jgi:AcrR family transcriptional regulator
MQIYLNLEHFSAILLIRKGVIMNNLSKVEEKKEAKKNKLLNASISLFLEKGFNNTTIQDIVDKAELAKGTFYLYFHDKYEIQNELIMRQSKKLFDNALAKLDTKKYPKLEDQIIFIIDNIINALSRNTLLLKFISKNLSWGLYSNKLQTIINSDQIPAREYFVKKAKEENLKLENPDITLYMIVELASATCFGAIINKQPLSINKMKPYLYETIKKMLN